MASTNTRQFAKAVEDFKTLFKKGKFTECAKQLTNLKVMMTQFPSLPPICKKSPSSVQENQLAREVLELAVLLSIKLEDENAFERNFLQLHSYYLDQKTLLPPSDKEYLILGLNLVRLLVQKRTAEFHTEMELIPPEVHDSDIYIKHAINLEQCLMEGAYDKVLKSKHNLPASEYYTYFIDQLASTVRDEIASCCEKAYDRLKVSEARELMLFRSDNEVVEYANNMVEVHRSLQEEERQRMIEDGDAMDEDSTQPQTTCGWELRDGVLTFQPEAQPPSKELSSMEVIKRALIYAKELERIV
ncbi:hypothetical protein BSKO_10084 [Bryopsis sp. KO-2023]|nr:hypothetical protein BSKO_10084 [Bryopsis sp. KO-2023]